MVRGRGRFTSIVFTIRAGRALRAITLSARKTALLNPVGDKENRLLGLLPDAQDLQIHFLRVRHPGPRRARP